jgi:(2Fe-2S) ferredoxin
MANDHEHCVAQDWEVSVPKVLDKLRFHIFLCTDGKDFCGCEANGNAALSGALRQELAKRRLMASVKINIMQCRQPGIAGPVLVVHPDGTWYNGLKAENVPEFIEQQILLGRPLERFVMRGGPQPVTAVPAHIVAAADCCGDRLTPEQQAEALAGNAVR